MSRYIGPSCRLCRREGEKLFLKGARCEGQKCALTRKSYIPGMHGMTKKFGNKMSEYGKHLREKQKARRIFGLSERQFHNLYNKASKSSAATGETFLKLLELRLDNATYRAGFADSRAMARQIVSHGLIRLNGKRVTVSSIQLKVGDKFEINGKKKDSKMFETAKKRKDTSPKWLVTDLKMLSAEVKALPSKEDFEPSIDSQLIVEFYSK